MSVREYLLDATIKSATKKVTKKPGTGVPAENAAKKVTKKPGTISPADLARSHGLVHTEFGLWAKKPGGPAVATTRGGKFTWLSDKEIKGKEADKEKVQKKEVEKKPIKPSEEIIRWWNSATPEKQKKWIKDHPNGLISRHMQMGQLNIGKKYGEENVGLHNKNVEFHDEHDEIQKELKKKITEIVPGQSVQPDAKGPIPVPVFDKQNIKKKHNVKIAHFDTFLDQEAATIAATAGHQQWQNGWKSEHGDEKREKTTKDEKWIEEHGADKVDIAHTKYEDLPEDWKKDNLASGSAAVNGLKDGIEKGIEDQDELIEHASDFVHKDWLKRNGEWAPESQKVEYKNLSEEEKEKDRLFVKAALKHVKETWSIDKKEEENILIKNLLDNRDKLKDLDWETLSWTGRQKLVATLDKEEDDKETPDMVTNEHKKLKTLMGNNLHIRDHSSPKVQNSIKAINNFTDDIIKGLTKRGIHIHINDGNLTDLDDFRRRKNKTITQNIGINKRTINDNYDDVLGVFNSGSQTVGMGCSKFDESVAASTIMHEIGHAIWNQLLTTEDENKLIELNNKHKNILQDYYVREDDPKTSANEMFAEACSSVSFDSFKDLLKKPETEDDVIQIKVFMGEMKEFIESKKILKQKVRK